MQRQSLGSPVSKLHGHGGGASKDDILSADLISPSQAANYDDEDNKAIKTRRFSSSPSSSSPSSLPSKPERLIHLIPLLTLLCFLVLYLASHSPSPSDLPQFKGFKHTDSSSAETSDVSKFADVRRADVLAIRGLRRRSLRELDAADRPKSRLSRKIADF